MNEKKCMEEAVHSIEEILYRYLPKEEGHQKTIFEAMNYSMKSGGKRLRPLLMRETFRLFHNGGEEKVIEPFMAAIEMIHTSSLIHDDLPCMDNDEFRRGNPTVWKKYGYDMAVLAGDALLIYAVEVASKAFAFGLQPEKVGRAIGILAEKTGIYGMIGGQTVDVELTEKAVSKEQLDFIYRLKTGALLQASMTIGALLGGADDTQLNTVEQMAASIGLAFQIQDDILDVTSSQDVLGKPVMSDEKNNKTTYVTLKGIDKAREDVKEITGQAVSSLHSLPGQNEFLESVVMMLITREK